ncbi:MarR family winged helix-turn-helix transcriptional regulator [Actinophytocola sp.]|uniref:MarR family winged helix-turn-helix transcriptional regulator n=1 Tax=Actinophytocola sp. TaxID=1872138 RepID=UPI002D7E5CAE|nr:MarR family winged helix-turn-helix transcriptional regulator [Actinophytocola sp.]HET9138104.1 MarR family winged helix-turn-helix transcriptional regulator [Actinophytocola sp.]
MMCNRMNSSESERFEILYRRIWGALNRPDSPELSQHERQVLHHVAPAGGVALTWLAGHLGLPKSTTSVLVKSLAARGFVERARDPADERRLAIRLTDKGRRTVEADTVLRPDALAAAMTALDPDTRAALLAGLEQLADAAEQP